MAINDPGPTPMGTHDSSVYLGWIKSMAEVLLWADGDRLNTETVQNYGGLMLALTESAEELLERERNGRKAT